MPGAETTLFWIALCAVLAPLAAGVIPRRLIPEVVLLLIAGVLLGPNVLGLTATGDAVGLLRELGLAMLFLLAGYELEVRELVGREGRRALLTWVVCFAIALVVVVIADRLGLLRAEIPIAIALTSTALGTLLPILTDNGQSRTRFGATVLRHGAFGELCPVIAMAVLLGARGSLGSVLALVMFAVVAVLATLPAALLPPESGLRRVIAAGSETTAQLGVRLVVLLLVGLGTLALFFSLDVVLGAFAAGFVLRRSVRAGHLGLERKLQGLAFGFLIPIFFVTSGMAIDPSAIAAQPLVLLLYLVGILLVRGGPIYLASRLDRDPGTRRRTFTGRESLSIALYGSTGLPVIVAVASVAVDSGQLSSTNASLLIAGGALTVLLLPAIASLLAPDPDLEPSPSGATRT